jgi:CarD family transcriptional regulator, regulator of rRNA transcription
MEYLVGDKVVHPGYGPGRIAGIVQQEMADGPRAYYVIDMVTKGLTVHVPVLKAEEAGVRPAMAATSLPQVLSTLRSRPRRLPDDPRLRDEEVGTKIRTGLVLPLARTVRDLAWRGARGHLTKGDTESLKQGQDRLAAEMALVSGGDVAESTKLIASTLAAAIAAA